MSAPDIHLSYSREDSERAKQFATQIGMMAFWEKYWPPDG
jgi:hypothetical protein